MEAIWDQSNFQLGGSFGGHKFLGRFFAKLEWFTLTALIWNGLSLGPKGETPINAVQPIGKRFSHADKEHTEKNKVNVVVFVGESTNTVSFLMPELYQ